MNVTYLETYDDVVAFRRAAGLWLPTPGEPMDYHSLKSQRLMVEEELAEVLEHYRTTDKWNTPKSVGFISELLDLYYVLLGVAVLTAGGAGIFYRARLNDPLAHEDRPLMEPAPFVLTTGVDALVEVYVPTIIDALSIYPSSFSGSDVFLVVCMATHTIEMALTAGGLPGAALWRALHAANMAKVANGVRYNNHGKVMKPAGWKPANIRQVLIDAGWLTEE